MSQHGGAVKTRDQLFWQTLGNFGEVLESISLPVNTYRGTADNKLSFSVFSMSFGVLRGQTTRKHVFVCA